RKPPVSSTIWRAPRSLPEQERVARGGNSGPLHFGSRQTAMRLSEQLRSVTVKAPLQSLLVAFALGGWLARRRWESCGTRNARNGEETEDLSDLAGLLRSRDGGAFDEGGARGVGRRQQPLPSRRREGDRRSRRGRRSHVEPRRVPEATGRIE